MQSTPQELLKQYVQSQHFTSTADIMAAMKEMFRDIIQQVMEVEMDEELGRERCQRATDPENTSPNYRNGYSQKTAKTQLGEIDIKVPRVVVERNTEKRVFCVFREATVSFVSCWFGYGLGIWITGNT